MDLASINNYIFGTKLFWPSLGFTTAIGMFVGALLYDGHLQRVVKAILSLLIYVFLVLLSIYDQVSSHAVVLTQINENHISTTMLLIRSVTVLFTSLSYSVGMLLGVIILNYSNRKK